MCILKKAAVAAGLGLVAVAALGSTKFGSYVETGWNKVSVRAERRVPLEFKLERIKTEVAKLAPDMEKHKAALAREIVEVDELRADVQKTGVTLEKRKAEILAMTSDLEKGLEKIKYNGELYTADRVKRKLEMDLASYDRAEAGFKSKQELLAAKERGLEAAKEQLNTMKQRKDDLEVEVATLEAEVKNVRLAQTRNNSTLVLDDRRLTDINSSLESVRKQLKVMKTKLELDAAYSNDPIKVEKKETSKDDLINTVKSKFGTKKEVANGETE